MNSNSPDEPNARKKRQGERNPGASLQQKLRNHAKATGEDVTLVLIRYLNERFLYRLSVSPYRDRFGLRGMLDISSGNCDETRLVSSIVRRKEKGGTG